MYCVCVRDVDVVDTDVNDTSVNYTIHEHHWFAAAVALAFRQAADCLQNGFSQFQSENPRSTGIPT